MDIAREAVETIAAGLKVPVALHVCGKIAPIFEQLVDWRGITLLSHAFMGDDNWGVLSSPRFLASGKMLGLGCIDTRNRAGRRDCRRGKTNTGRAEKIPSERLVIHPDCGLRLLPRAAALDKMKNMVAGVRKTGEMQLNSG